VSALFMAGISWLSRSFYGLDCDRGALKDGLVIGLAVRCTLQLAIAASLRMAEWTDGAPGDPLPHLESRLLTTP